MNQEQLISKSGEAHEFSHDLRVVPLDYALKAIAAEREACAKVCEELEESNPSWTNEAGHCAGSIRMRSNAKVNGAGTASAGLPG